MDVINTISLNANTDTAHRIYFLRDGTIQSMPLAELDRQGSMVASHLHDLGIGQGDRVGVMAANCVEWVLLDLALLKLGAVVAGFDAGRFEASATIERYGLQRMFVEHATEGDPRVLGMETVREWASSTQPQTLTASTHAGYQSDDICAIKFTSGSTGAPKGMEVTVGGINDSLSSVQEMFRHGHGDNILVFLRLAQLQQRYWIYSALVFGHDITIVSLDDALPVAQAVHPTVVMGVPGFFDDVKRQLEKTADFGSDDHVGRSQAIQALFGGRIRYLWTGSAPASRATLDFYNDCGVPLYQGYGLNETCIVAKNCPEANRIGSVGRVLPNQTVRFDAQGMLIVGSRHPIIKRYTWCAPGDNERMFLPSGEVITHDLGYLDEDNYLYILGRVDDIIVLGTGRNVLVGPIEERLKDHPGVHECVLYGNGKPFLTALVSPASDAVDKASIESHLHATNATLFPEQQIRGLVIATERFSIDNGLLTSQFKPIRKEIYARLASEIEAVYEQGGGNILWRGAYGQ
jgi:long-subunit acyl-CoA synthetase (AMP-forming)